MNIIGDTSTILYRTLSQNDLERIKKKLDHLYENNNKISNVLTNNTKIPKLILDNSSQDSINLGKHGIINKLSTNN